MKIPLPGGQRRAGPWRRRGSPWGEGPLCPTLVLAQEPIRDHGQTHMLLERKATVIVTVV